MSERDESFEERSHPAGEQVSGLLEVARAIDSSASLGRLLKTAAVKTAQVCGVDRCSIWLWRDDKLFPAMSQFASEVRAPELWDAFMSLGPSMLDDIPACKRAFLTRGPIVMDDPVAGGLAPRDWVDHFVSRGAVVVPLLRGDELVGIMALDDTTARISQVQLWLADLISRQLALAIDRARGKAEVRRRLQERNRLLKVALTLGSTLDLQEVMRRIARESARSVGADTGGMFFIGQETHVLHPLVGYHVPKPLLEVVQGGRLDATDFHRLVALFRQGRRSIWSDDVPGDPNFDHAIFRRLGMRSLFVTLLKAGTRVLGVLICVWWTRPYRFRPETLRLLEGIASHAAVALANAHLYRQAEIDGINRERGRVAKKLHDTLNQTAFTAALRLDVCLHSVPPELSEFRGTLEAIKRDIGMIMGQIRQLIGELGPERIVAVGLSDRVRTVIDEARGLSGIRIEFTEQGDSAVLGPSQQEVLLKTFQEALANIVKHSGASRAEARLEVLADEVRFAVTDDGIGVPAGISVARLTQLPGHFGLQQILEQIEALGGELELGNGDPSGFFVKGRLPIRR